jgi:uncharacterized membrane protein (DUF106 family)
VYKKIKMASKSMLIILIVFAISIVIASMWDSYPIIKTTVNSILDPTLGKLLDINFYFGFIIIVGVISLILTLSQKYLTNQQELKELKKEQKILQEERKKYKDHPEKLLEFQKKQLEFIPKTFDLTMKPAIYTSIPLILLFRWFGDNFHPVLGGWWILWYILVSLIFTSIFRKIFDVA